MIVSLTASGESEIEHNYGELPFPPGQLFEPDRYRTDVSAYPRDRLPVWLAAYIGHGDRQVRTPQRAAALARADRADQVWATLSENEFPPSPRCGHTGRRTPRRSSPPRQWGPRMTPWLGVFEGASRSGSTLHVLPAGRAALSGGVWDAPALDLAYTATAYYPTSMWERRIG